MAANRGLDESALAFANHDEQVGVPPIENGQKPASLHDGLLDIVVVDSPDR